MRKGDPEYSGSNGSQHVTVDRRGCLVMGRLSRWIAFIGYATALALLFVGHYLNWIVLVFPIWVVLLSLHILTDNFGVWPKVGASDSEREGDV